MDHENLEAIRVFHRELLLIQSMGIPVHFGNALKPQSLATTLEAISARFTLQSGRGQTLEQWLANDSEVPQSYRASLDRYLRTGKLAESVESLTAVTDAQKEISRTISLGLIQPIILFAMTYAGFILLCFVVAPKLEAIYAQQWQTPSPSLQFLIILRELFPFWGIGVPLLFTLILFYWHKRQHQFRFVWLPGAKSYFAFIQQSQYASQLANLLEHGYSRAAALAFTGVLPQSDTPNTKLANATTYLISKSNADEAVAWNDPQIVSLPSLLRWGLTTQGPALQQAESLRFTARVYRNIAEARQRAWYVWLPILMTAILGGTLVLIFALSLFVPLIDVLMNLAQSPGDRP